MWAPGHGGGSALNMLTAVNTIDTAARKRRLEDGKAATGFTQPRIDLVAGARVCHVCNSAQQGGWTCPGCGGVQCRGCAAAGHSICFVCSRCKPSTDNPFAVGGCCACPATKDARIALLEQALSNASATINQQQQEVLHLRSRVSQLEHALHSTFGDECI
mgnify:CR=1 FL=1